MAPCFLKVFAYARQVVPPKRSSASPLQPAGVFATTHWSVVVQAGDSQSPEAGFALERLCRTYWYPLYVFVRRKGKGHEDACDLTQGFFALFLEKHYLRSVNASLGKFRTFLLTSLTHFMANEADKARAQRRGGDRPALSLDEAAAEARYEVETADHETPERVFERRWVQTVMGLVLDRLAAETGQERFEVLKDFMLAKQREISYEEAAKRLGMSVAAVTSAIHRLRGRFRALLYEEIANTVEKPEEVESEIRYLLSVLSD